MNVSKSSTPFHISRTAPTSSWTWPLSSSRSTTATGRRSRWRPGTTQNQKRRMSLSTPGCSGRRSIRLSKQLPFKGPSTRTIKRMNPFTICCTSNFASDTIHRLIQICTWHPSGRTWNRIVSYMQTLDFRIVIRFTANRTLIRTRVDGPQALVIKSAA